MGTSVIDPACQCAHAVLKRVVDEGEYKAIWKCLDCKREFLTFSADMRPGKIEIMPPMEGMRDRFAMSALNATQNWMQDRIDSYPEIAKRCYLMADVMLKAREEK